MRERRGGSFKDAVGDASVVLEPSQYNVQQFTDHSIAAKVPYDKFYLSNALFNVEGAKVQTAEEGGQEAEGACKVLTDSELAEDYRCHWLLDVFKLAFRKVTHWKAVPDTPKKDAEVIDPRMVVFTGACREKTGMSFGFL
jgi:hypothetical protein